MYIAMNHFRVSPDRCEEFERGWRDEAAFRAWTESEAFQKAHRQGRSTAGTILGPPRFVGWQVVL